MPTYQQDKAGIEIYLEFWSYLNKKDKHCQGYIGPATDNLLLSLYLYRSFKKVYNGWEL